MNSSDLQGMMAALLGIVALTFVVCVGYYVWYGFALARLFPKIGGEGWKGWVPILNEAEILARGGVPGWSVVFYFIPVLQLYGLYLKVVAVQRISFQFGRGVGSAILGILLPPVWATVLVASHHGDTGEFERRVASIMPARPVPPSDDDFDGAGPNVRRPQAVWNLVLDDGRIFPLTGVAVALGRKPSSADPAVQVLPIPDLSRTLSKNHARLTLDGGQWTITDLGSTNGVLLVGEDGAERLLGPAEPTILSERFILGTVGMRIDCGSPALT